MEPVGRADGRRGIVDLFEYDIERAGFVGPEPISGLMSFSVRNITISSNMLLELMMAATVSRALCCCPDTVCIRTLMASPHFTPRSLRLG